MNIPEQIKSFSRQYNNNPALSAVKYRPLWIHVMIMDHRTGLYEHFVYDFKNDHARRAFGALCHCIYVAEDGEHFEIRTKKDSESL